MGNRGVLGDEIDSAALIDHNGVMTAVGVAFWFDPACPWCWLTSRWLVDVARDRELDITWRSISLHFKNAFEGTGHPLEEPTRESLRLLRVIEAVRTVTGDSVIGSMYTQFGEAIHHRGEAPDIGAVLQDLGLSMGFASELDNSDWDEVIRASQRECESVVGKTVGVPVVAVESDVGLRGFFGPVLSQRLTQADAVALWDAVLVMNGVDGLWELKRERTESPHFEVPGVVSAGN